MCGLEAWACMGVWGCAFMDKGTGMCRHEQARMDRGQGETSDI